MAFPDVVAAELLAHEVLQQHLPDRFQRRVRQQQFAAAATVFHVDAQLDENGRVRRLGDGGKARVRFDAVEFEVDSRQRIERLAGVVEDHLDEARHQHALDGGVGPAFDAHRNGAAAAAEQHVDDRVDKVGINRQQAEIVELPGLEHGKDGRQRDRVQIVAKAHRLDRIQRHLDVVGGEVAQAGGHQAHEAVEHDLEHRQAFVGDERRVDERAHAATLGAALFFHREAEQRVDLILVEDAL